MCTVGKRAGLPAVGISWQHCSPVPSERPAAHARRHQRSAGAPRPGTIQTSKAHKVGPRFSEFLGRSSSVVGPTCYSEGGKARILGISSNPNLKAQLSKVGQNRERLHSGWQVFSQVHDALGRTVTEELGRLSQMLHPQGVETHQTGADEVGGYGI